MYLKFINECGEVFRYNEVKKRIIIGMAMDYIRTDKRKYKVTVNKITVDVTKDIELLHEIFITDFKADSFKFQSVFSNALFYVSIPQQYAKNVLILFGSLYLNLKTRQFYSVPIINGNVLLQNALPVKTPYYYKM